MAEQQQKRVVILNPQRFKLAEQARRDWIVEVEVGTTVEDVLDPAYWAHVAADFNDFDHVEARLETGDWVLELTVLQHDRNWARMFVRHKHEIIASAAEPLSAPSVKYRVDYKGTHHKYAVIRVADNEMLQSGIASKLEAMRWLQEYESRTAS